MSLHAIYLCFNQFVWCLHSEWKQCSWYTPPATVVFLIFLGFEALLFSIFTMVMFATQLQAICSDETVIFYCFLYISKTVQNNFYNEYKKNFITFMYIKTCYFSYLIYNV